MKEVTIIVSNTVKALYDEFFPKIKEETDKIVDMDGKIDVIAYMLGYLMEKCEDNYNREIFNETAALIVANITHMHLNEVRKLTAAFKFKPNITN